MTVNQPVTWGMLHFGVPNYTPSATAPGGSVTVRHKLNGTTVSDAAAGGYAVCGAGERLLDSNGATRTESFYSVDHDRFNVQNQSDVSDWPCFSKYYVAFPLNSLPTGQGRRVGDVDALPNRQRRRRLDAATRTVLHPGSHRGSRMG